MLDGSISYSLSTRAGSVNSQSRSHSPTPSYVLSPTTPIGKWDQKGQGQMGTHLDPRSIVSVPANHHGVRSKPSPLRLQLSDAELKERLNHNPYSNFDESGGVYLAPPATPRSLLSGRTVSPSSQKEWVSPLDVHFIRPSTSGTSSPGSSRYYWPAIDRCYLECGVAWTRVRPV